MVTHDVLRLITIDGPAASGKTTLSRNLAKRLGWQWISTGVFYRGVAFAALQERIDLNDTPALVELCQNRTLWQVRMSPERTLFFYQGHDYSAEIGHEDIGSIASRLSRIPLIRELLLPLQRQCFDPSVGLVAEGRDCGTVVFPQAPLKFFLLASAEERAARRAMEMSQSKDLIMQKQAERDRQDQNREVAPLKKADQCIEINTSQKTQEEVFDEVWTWVKKIF